MEFPNEILKSIYQGVARRQLEETAKVIRAMDDAIYEREYTPEEKEQIKEVNNLEEQYWADQIALHSNDPILALHSANYPGDCDGCDEAWPCRTVRLILRGSTDDLDLPRPKRPLRKRSGSIIYEVHK